MKVGLFYPLSEGKYLNKDLAGGYGTRRSIGRGILAKILEMQKAAIRAPYLHFAYISAILKKNGHEVIYSDSKIPQDCDIIFLPSSIIDYKNEVNVAKNIKEKTRSKVGFVGTFASVMPEIYLKAADFVIIGEPEEAVMKIKDKVLRGKVISKPMPNLDTLPYPDWGIFPESYFSYRPIIQKTPFFTIQSSRGCPYGCGKYCPYVVAQGNVHRARSVKSVIDEIKYLKDKYGVKALLFRDIVFTLDMKRAEQIAKEMIRNKFDIEWACETRIDRLTLPLVKLFHKAGLRSMNLGIESASDEVLRSSSRLPIKTEHQEEIVNYCEKNGIKISAFYIIGMHDDTRKTVLETIRYAKKLNTDIALFTINTPYPGTPYYNEIKDRIFKGIDWKDFDAYTPVYRHESMAKEELLWLKEKAYISYYFRSRWMIRYVLRRFKDSLLK